MRNKLINTFRILFVIALIILGVLVLFRPANTETNILKAIFSSEQDNILVDLSSKFSSKINVIVESGNPEKSEEVARTIYGRLDKTKMYTSDLNILAALSEYEKYHNNLLSSRMRVLLKDKSYGIVEENALEALYNPIMAPVGSIEDDPFLLLTDFVMSLAANKQVSDFVPNEYNNKFYSLVMLNVDSDIALAPTVLNDEVKKLVDLQKEYSKDGVKVYLTGAPVHSYFASSHSIFEINLICILSTLFIIGLVFWYFRSLKPLFPIIASIGLGIFAGYCVTSLIFKDIHILTFVFSTTLIGICVDYSLHYFVSDEGSDTVKEIFKSLTVSLISTVSAFIVLLFANFILLKQISVFTITGLTVVYLIVILFYPIICKSFNFNKREQKHFDIPDKYRKITIYTVCVIALAGLFRTHFDDNIKNMYIPPKNLLNAEKLFGELAGTNGETSIFVVKGENLEDILQKEEAIADKLTGENIEYQALSLYMPSVKRQKSNQILRKQLYKDKLNEYAVFLPASQRLRLMHQKYEGFLKLNDDFEFLKKNFLIDKNTSIMVVYDYDGGGINNARIINFQKDISAQIKKCRQICLSLLLPIFGLLYLLLAKIYDYKSGFKIILPSIMSVAFVFGVLGIFGIHVNLFHLLAIFLIIGFGLDYSVFRFNGARKCADAVLMSCLTSVFSFALLAFAGFKLISSLGTVLALGLLSSYIFSLILISSANGSGATDKDMASNKVINKEGKNGSGATDRDMTNNKIIVKEDKKNEV